MITQSCLLCWLTSFFSHTARTHRRIFELAGIGFDRHGSRFLPDLKTTEHVSSKSLNLNIKLLTYRIPAKFCPGIIEIHFIQALHSCQLILHNRYQHSRTDQSKTAFAAVIVATWSSIFWMTLPGITANLLEMATNNKPSSNRHLYLTKYLLIEPRCLIRAKVGK